MRFINSDKIAADAPHTRKNPCEFRLTIWNELFITFAAAADTKHCTSSQLTHKLHSHCSDFAMLFQHKTHLFSACAITRRGAEKKNDGFYTHMWVVSLLMLLLPLTKVKNSKNTCTIHNMISIAVCVCECKFIYVIVMCKNHFQNMQVYCSSIAGCSWNGAYLVCTYSHSNISLAALRTLRAMFNIQMFCGVCVCVCLFGCIRRRRRRDAEYEKHRSSHYKFWR